MTQRRGSGEVRRVQTTPIDPADLVAVVSAPDRGAVATFAGVVRDHNLGRRVLRLEYHAYEPMADREIAAIAAEAGARFPGTCVAIVHRLGVLEVGEISVLVAAAAPHRREALAACAWAIDEVKSRAPIWKKEHGEGGASWLEGPGDCAGPV
jgi:molybdopterin synthase catalytic subunit